MGKLKEVRQAAGLTQKQLAEKSGVSLSAIQKYERGAKDLDKAGLNIILALQKALDCKIDDLQDYWLEVEQTPEDKILTLFEDLTIEQQRAICKECAENIGMIIIDSKTIEDAHSPVITLNGIYSAGKPSAELLNDLKLLDGEFYEGEMVTVSINGKTVTRKVHYDTQAGDLYIVCDNNRYFLSEF